MGPTLAKAIQDGDVAWEWLRMIKVSAKAEDRTQQLLLVLPPHCVLVLEFESLVTSDRL